VLSAFGAAAHEAVSAVGIDVRPDYTARTEAAEILEHLEL
jgi:hypothetical protein